MGIHGYGSSATARNCKKCTEDRLKLRRQKPYLKLFAATRPGEYVAIDNFGPLPRIKAGYQYIFVTSDLFNKQTVTPLVEIRALSAGKTFHIEWIYHYGAPDYLWSDLRRNTSINSSSQFELFWVRHIFLHRPITYISRETESYPGNRINIFFEFV